MVSQTLHADLQPQLSQDLIKIMEQRLSAIEHRSTYLQGVLNQVKVILNFFFTKNGRLKESYEAQPCMLIPFFSLIFTEESKF